MDDLNRELDRAAVRGLSLPRRRVGELYPDPSRPVVLVRRVDPLVHHVLEPRVGRVIEIIVHTDDAVVLRAAAAAEHVSACS